VATEGVAIRSCHADDVPAVLELWNMAPGSHPATADAVEQLLACAPDALLVAEQSRQVVGTLIAAWDGWRGNMYRLAVHPDHRRRGVALRLVRAGEERLRARGARRITALVVHEDDAAAAFWGAADYVKHLEMRRFVRNV